ncbi:hypothetical protein HMI54_007668 [Coelomomyces lativittatus]|nr:hypothetical protein HMI56_003521 [Coelomomyces lativittatus]KAJ1516934.1 hypothetical protein HMI54_007668 [Coelomomyces lativittatus]KAJ1517142.1 hypothetical protein HMI55_000547 [Coelomomyces lativittatus]
MMKHLDNIRSFGIPAIVALNKFSTDSQLEMDLIAEACRSVGVPFSICNHFAEGGKGAVDLGRQLISLCESYPKPNSIRHLYSLDASISEKILRIAHSYGASDVSYSDQAKAQLGLFTRMGFANFPICMAKTHLSFSHRSDWKGVPKDFVLPIREIRVSAGAGFIYPIVGEMQTMPGLPTRPCFYDIDIDLETEKVIGLC